MPLTGGNRSARPRGPVGAYNRIITNHEPASRRRLDVVDEVRYYDDVRDLLEQLEPGRFHVVYPDPTFAGCEQVMNDSDYCPHHVEFTPWYRAEEPAEKTPLVHWWFAFCTARLGHGPYDWTSLIFDECADLAPDSARADENQTDEKVTALRRVMADSRKYYVSLFFFAHHEETLHSRIRRTIRWRVNMPDGTANPCQRNNDQPPIGFNQIPMRADLMSRQDVGRGLFWTETNFTRFSWSHFAVEAGDSDRWLKISPSASPSQAGTSRARIESTGLTGGGDV